MQMIGQHDECIDGEWIVLPSRSDGLAQLSNAIDKQNLPSIEQVYGKEPAPTGNECATIVRHEVQFSTQPAVGEMADYAFG